MKKVLLFISVGFSLLGFSIISCQKTNPYINAAALDTTTTVATTNASNAQSANDASNASESNISHPGSPGSQFVSRSNQLQDGSTINSSAGNLLVAVHFKGGLGDSVTAIPQGPHSPGIIKSDFGAGVTLNGKVRKGAIISHFINKYYQVGFSDTITFQNYKENGKAVSGTIILTRISDTSFTRVCQLSFTLNGGPSNTYSSSTTRAYSFHLNAAGFLLPPTFTINETGYATSHNGSSGTLDTAKIIHPLQYLFSSDCSITGGVFPVKGTVSLTSSGLKAPRIVDYGTGSCDLKFTVTIGTVVKTITLSSSFN